MRASLLCTSVACLTAAVIGFTSPVAAQQSPKVVSGPGAKTPGRQGLPPGPRHETLTVLLSRSGVRGSERTEVR